MNIHNTTVVKYADKFGIGEILRSSNNLRNGHKSPTTKKVNLLEERKEKLIKYIEDNKGTTKAEYRKLFPTEFHYLFRKDRKWLSDKLPSVSKPKNRVGYLEKIDESHFDKIPSAVERIKNYSIPVRITYGSIAREMNWNQILVTKNRRHLPKVIASIENQLETFEEFRIREKVMIESREEDD